MRGLFDRTGCTATRAVPQRRRFARRSLSLGVAGILACAGLATIATSLPAGATTDAFTTQGCSIFTVPSGVSSIGVNAVGAAGGDGDNSLGGNGDEVSATLSLPAGYIFDVCVELGGGSAGSGGIGSAGDGGGTSGVSLSATFTAPVVVAGGGGGGGAGPGGNGGDAGSPVGATGQPSVDTTGGGGGDTTTATGGSGGSGLGSGGNGALFNDGGPSGGAGAGGTVAGGGGGAGYEGGGGGGAGNDTSFGGSGGGGGSDFCSTASAVTGCTVTSGAGTNTAAGSTTGDAEVVLTYTAATTTEASNTASVSSAGAQSVTLDATVTSPGTVVSEGTVTFTLEQGLDIIGSPTTSSTLAAGAATVSYTLPAGTPAGSYTIDAVYNPGVDYVASEDTSHTLNNVGNTATAASNALTSYSALVHSVTLNATVDSGGSGVNEGTVTFTLMQGATAIGTATTSSTVAAGAASVSYALPAGTAAGSYTIDAVYNAGANYFGSSDTTHTLDVASAPAAPTTAPQATLTLSTVSGTVGTALPLATTGGSGTGVVTYTVTNGTATGCAISGSSLIATSPGTCVVTAAKAASGSYQTASSSATAVTLVAPAAPAVPFRAIRVIGRVTGGKTSTVKVVGSGFYGSPRITSNIAGFSARVARDVRTSLTVVVTVKSHAGTGLRVMTLTLANGEKTSVKYRLH